MRKRRKKKIEKKSSLCSELSYVNGERESETPRASVYSGGSVKSDSYK